MLWATLRIDLLQSHILRVLDQSSKYLASGGLKAFDSIMGDFKPALERADSSRLLAQPGKFGPVVIE